MASRLDVINREIEAVQRLANAREYTYHTWISRGKQRRCRLTWTAKNWFEQRLRRLKDIRYQENRYA